MQNHVLYVDRHGRNTAKFTQELETTAQVAAAQGYAIIAAVPNTGLGETIGIWLFLATGSGTAASA